jgi:hypothetical protein
VAQRTGRVLGNVIRDVLVLGNGGRSQNGRRYSAECLRRAVTKYENRPVYDGHDRSNRDRPPSEMCGRIISPRFVANDQGRGPAIRADLRVVPSHPVGRALLDAAADPDNCGRLFCLSHDALADDWKQEGDNQVVLSLGEIRSVDCVVDGATVSGLFESRGNRHSGRLRRRAGAHLYHLAHHRPGWTL